MCRKWWSRKLPQSPAPTQHPALPSSDLSQSPRKTSTVPSPLSMTLRLSLILPEDPQASPSHSLKVLTEPEQQQETSPRLLTEEEQKLLMATGLPPPPQTSPKTPPPRLRSQSQRSERDPPSRPEKPRLQMELRERTRQQKRKSRHESPPGANSEDSLN